MAGLGRKVGGDQVVPDFRAKAVGDQARRGRDKSVDHHWTPRERTAESHAGQEPDLESSDLGEDVQSVVWIGPVYTKGTIHNGDLVP